MMNFLEVYLAIMCALITAQLYENWKEEQRRKKYNKNVNKR